MNKDHKILLIIPQYYGYEKIIEKTANELGIGTTVILENLPNISYFYRFVNVYLKSVKDKMFDKYYFNKLSKLNLLNYDSVLVIRGETISNNVLQYMRLKNKRMKFILYQWDSVKNNPNALKIAEKFDNIYTFDMYDSKELNWKYRPLFYSMKKSDNTKCDYDLAMISAIHSERNKVYKILKEKYCQYNGFYYLYTPKLLYLKKKYFNKSSEYYSLDYKDVYFKSLSISDTNDIYNKSKVIMDYVHPDQAGFTMRTIESIGAKCKLITNNKNVAKADFYNPNNIFIYDIDNFEILPSFFCTEYQDLSQSLYDKYSIKEWLKELLEI